MGGIAPMKHIVDVTPPAICGAKMPSVCKCWGAEEEVKTWSNEANFTVISVVKCRFGNRISIVVQLRRVSTGLSGKRSWSAGRKRSEWGTREGQSGSKVDFRPNECQKRPKLVSKET